MADGVDLDAHLGDEATLVSEFGQLANLKQIVRQRFLAVNVFSQLHRAHGDAGVHVVGGGDVHGIDVFGFFIEELSPVLINFDVGESLF